MNTRVTCLAPKRFGVLIDIAPDVLFLEDGTHETPTKAGHRAKELKSTHELMVDGLKGRLYLDGKNLETDNA